MAGPNDHTDQYRPAPPDELDQLFTSWRRGDTGAFDKLFAQLYEQLRVLAHRQSVRAGAGDTLRTTAVLHEAYLRLADSQKVDVQGREHFFSLAARAMRFVLVDHARKHMSEKRGSGAAQVAIEEIGELVSLEATAEEVLHVNQALERLIALDPRQARVFELRVFGGLTVDEVAELLAVPRATIKRDWQKAKLYVARELTGGVTT